MTSPEMWAVVLWIIPSIICTFAVIGTMFSKTLSKLLLVDDFGTFFMTLLLGLLPIGSIFLILASLSNIESITAPPGWRR